MRTPIFPDLGHQLKQARLERALTQPELAMRLGRDRARISELERDLLNERMGRDRLTLLAEICDALDLVPILVPGARASAVRSALQPADPAPPRGAERSSAFDDVFVDLSEEEDG